jgi:hypothetical protein
MGTAAGVELVELVLFCKNLLYLAWGLACERYLTLFSLVEEEALGQTALAV